MVDDAQLMMLPLELCRSVRMLGGTALTIKAMLVLESARALRQEVVSMPVGDLADAVGTRREHVWRAVDRLREVRCMIASHDGSEWLTFDVVEGRDGAEVGKGRDAVATLRTTEGWRMSCDRDRTVPVPLDEVRDMTTRAGLLMRLRVGALLHGREVPSDPRVRIRTGDLPHYTGYDGVGSPSTMVTQHLFPGVDDVNAHSDTVELRVREVYRDGAPTRPRLKHLDLRVTPLARRARSWHVLRDALDA